MDDADMDFPRPLSSEEMEKRRQEKQMLFAMRYGSSAEEMQKYLYRIEMERRKSKLGWWEAIKRWWREDVAQSHHKGCGGEWVESGTSGYAVLRIYFVCSKCFDEHVISHSPGD